MLEVTAVIGITEIDLFIYSLLFCFFRAMHVAYGSSQARGQIRTVYASLYHSSQQCRILRPLSKARDQTCILTDTSRVRLCCATTGTPCSPFKAAHAWLHSSATLISAALPPLPSSPWSWAGGCPCSSGPRRPR